MTFPIVSGSYVGGPQFWVIAGPFKTLEAAQRRARKIAKSEGSVESLLIVYDPPNRSFEACYHVGRVRSSSRDRIRRIRRR